MVVRIIIFVDLEYKIVFNSSVSFPQSFERESSHSVFWIPVSTGMTTQLKNRLI